MKNKLVILAVTLLLVLGIIQVAAAGPGWGGGGPRGLNSDNWTGLVDTLNLTGEQITKMREINQNTYQQTRELRIQLMDSMHELRQMRLQKNPDQAQIDAKIKEINDLRDKIRSITLQGRQQCQSLLTPEQRAKVNEFRGKWGCGFKGGPGTGNSQSQ